MPANANLPAMRRSSYSLLLGMCLMSLSHCQPEKQAPQAIPDTPVPDAGAVVFDAVTTRINEGPGFLEAVWPGKLAAERYQTCLLEDDGSVVCFGKISGKPKVVIPQGIVQITSGIDYTCALTREKKILCWNEMSFLERKIIPSHARTYSAPHHPSYQVRSAEVPGFLPNVAAIAAGERNLCALLTDGRIQCRGQNLWGQLGIGKESQAPTKLSDKIEEEPPTLVVDLPSSAIAVTAGRWHTCALLADKRLACWGFNQFGQLGDGTTTLRRNKPVLVNGLPGGVFSVSAGYNHTCAVLETGRVFCWGINDKGQIGNGFIENDSGDSNVLTPTEVLGLSGPAVGIFLGGQHSCALLADGRVECWGSNEYGELGDGCYEKVKYRSRPTAVEGLDEPVMTMTAAEVYNCARLTSGTVKCWGTFSASERKHFTAPMATAIP